MMQILFANGLVFWRVCR